MKTIIQNQFTKYRAEIKTQGLPAISTIKKHLRRSKAADCRSMTTITIDDCPYDLYYGEPIKQ